ncbi:MAG: hypothetical protein AAB074_01040 [Planctomycetota bacterium]
MRSILLIIALALPVAADPDLSGLANRLASEDPEVRAAAREELLRQDERIAPALRAAAEKVEDAEARAALLEIAELLEEGGPLAYAKDWAWKAAGNQVTLDDVLGWKVAPERVFLCWLRRADGIAEEVTRGNNLFREDRPDPRLLEAAGTRWLRAYTLAEIGPDAVAWETFRVKTRGMSWEEIRLEGLEGRGFRVRDADPDVVAAEFLLAGRVPLGGAQGRNVRPLRPATPEVVDSFARLTGGLFKGCPVAGELDAALDWIEACGKTFWRKGSRIVSHAGPDDFVAATRSPREGVALAALAALENWPGRVPPECWGRVEANPSLVLRVMAKAGIPSPREHLPAVLRTLGKEPDAATIRRVTNTTDLSDLALERTADSEDRERAFRCLARVEAKAAGVAARSLLEAYKAEDGFEGHVVARAAAIAAAEEGAPAGLDLAEDWLKLAPENYERIDVAIALARKGRRAGFDLIVDRARRDLLDRRRCAKVRDFVDSAPELLRDDLWPKWARDDAPACVWDEATKQWRTKK